MAKVWLDSNKAESTESVVVTYDLVVIKSNLEDLKVKKVDLEKMLVGINEAITQKEALIVELESDANRPKEVVEKVLEEVIIGD